MKIERLFGIIYLLLDGKMHTTSSLATYFGVSKRTILRDINTLSVANIPVYTVKGKGGGVGLLDGFTLKRGMFSEDEQNELLFYLKSLSATRNIDVEKSLDKLSGIFNKQAASWIEVDFSRWDTKNNDKLRFEKIKTTILNQRVLLFRYINSKGKRTERAVFPIKLIFKSKYWYLQAFDCSKNQYRLFKLTRMINIEIGAHYEATKIDSLPVFQNINYDDNLIQVKLLFDESVGYRVFDEFEVETIIQNEKGALLVDSRLPYDQWLINFLLSFGTQVKVLKPKMLNEQLLLQAKKIYYYYKNL